MAEVTAEPPVPVTTEASPPATLLIAADTVGSGTAQAQALQRTLESALAQSLQSTQVLLLLPEGAPAPQLPEPGQAPQLQVVPCPAGNPAAAWNLGLERSAGEYVAFLTPGAVVDEDYLIHLLAQALIEDAEMCHGEYVLELPGGDGPCTDTASLARGDDSPLPCLGVLWTTLWRRSFLTDLQLRFEEEFAGGCELVFQVRALLSCRHWALCEGRVGCAAALAQPQLTPGELTCRLAACRAVGRLLLEARAQLPQRALARALAWLTAEVRRHPDCGDTATALAGQCPPELQEALAQEAAAQTEARAVLSVPQDPPAASLDVIGSHWRGQVSVRKVQARLREQILTRIDPAHDDVYMLLMHQGDAYTMLCFMEAMIRRHASRNPVVAVWTDKHAQLAAMVRPDLPLVLLSGPPMVAARYFEELIAASQIRVGPFRIFLCSSLYVLHQCIDTPAVRRHDGQVVPMMRSYEQYMGCRLSDCAPPRLCLPSEARTEALREAGRHGLDVRRFVMLCPETLSYQGPGLIFWKALAMALRARGCGVYVNAVSSQTWPREAGCTFALSFAGACALGFLARRIIAARSGMLELLVQSGVAMDVLYVSDFLRRRMTLSCYPYADPRQLREYDLSQLGDMGCLKKLLAQPMP